MISVIISREPGPPSILRSCWPDAQIWGPQVLGPEIHHPGALEGGKVSLETHNSSLWTHNCSFISTIP